MTEWDISEYLLKTRALLPPLECDSVLTEKEGLAGADALLTTLVKGKFTEQFLFLVEIKSKSTPQAIHHAIAQIKVCLERKSDPEMHPMIVVPYLSEERLHELEAAGVSGIDLCGNGVISVPNRLYILRTGRENLHPESRPVSNPFQGKSAMVARVFFGEPTFHSEKSTFQTLDALQQAIVKGGTRISLSQVSKAVSALEERRLLGSAGRAIFLLDPDRIMEKLAHNWKPATTGRVFLRLGEQRLEKLSALNRSPDLKWAITGVSSVAHHTPFAQGGAIQVAVPDTGDAMAFLGGSIEPIPNFADVELLETDEPGYYFENDIDESWLRWASLLQTWIELKNGDARQQDAARSIYDLIIAPSNQ